MSSTVWRTRFITSAKPSVVIRDAVAPLYDEARKQFGDAMFEMVKR